MRLWQYIVRRILYLIPLFIGISIVVFILTRLAGDPVQLMTLGNPRMTEEQRQIMRAYFGLLGNPLDQYIHWFVNFVQLNFGYSFWNHVSVNTIIGWYSWNTIELQLIALLFSMMIAIPIGIMSARKQYSKTDQAVTTTALLGVSVPVFVLGLAGIMLFALTLRWLPWGGAFTAAPNSPLFGNIAIDHLIHLVMPALILTMADLATIVLLVRSSMLEVLRQDYIVAAQASGLSDRTVIYKHALRNVMIPVVTYTGLYLGGMLAGAPVTETVFNWPGLGRLYVTAVQNLDFPIIQAVTMIITLMVLFANLATDILYAYIDPRIRLD
ncbi:MAG: ABC transporter permease [Promethearchaeati archaeon SRVP18_Atabeyarchaeia-1]